jgi:hypothetical protein
MSQGKLGSAPLVARRSGVYLPQCCHWSTIYLFVESVECAVWGSTEIVRIGQGFLALRFPDFFNTCGQQHSGQAI